MTDEVRLYLTVEQALSVISDKHHSFINKFGILFGCDHSKEFIIDLLKSADYIEIAGDTAKAMSHGIAVRHSGRYYFFETDKDKLVKLELELLAKNNAKA